MSSLLIEKSAEEPIIISSSPVKDDGLTWLSKLNLTKSDREILRSDAWLNDNIIHAAQSLLREQTKGSVFGWRSTQCAKNYSFKPIPSRSPFVQVLHVAECHWVVVSNVDPKEGGCFTNSVAYYDSGWLLNIGARIRNTLCSFFKCDAATLRFDIVDVMTQPNASDCGVFALANATELAYGSDPALCRWDSKNMRQHLLQCFQNGQIDRFPVSGKRRIPLGSRIRKSYAEKLYCICRMPNSRSRAMIQCDRCKNYFHMDCMKLDDHKSYENEEWSCHQCLDMLDKML